LLLFWLSLLGDGQNDPWMLGSNDGCDMLLVMKQGIRRSVVEGIIFGRPCVPQIRWFG